MSYYPPEPPTVPSMPFGAVPPPPPRRNRRTLTLALAAVASVLALIVASGVVLVVKARNGDIQIPGLTLQAANYPGDDPFGPNVAVSNKPLPDGMRLASQQGALQSGTRVVNGTQPGLYAGGDNTCDTAALANYLGNNPAQARAWASVFGISTSSIPYYLDSLSPVVLTADTWVTNHTFTGGVASPFQSVLQAGTAVLVDGAGVPRVRCSCGNPLAPPAAAPVGGYRLYGHPWANYQTRYVTRVAYNTQNVTVVNNTTTVVNQAPAPAPATPTQSALTLLNLVTGALFDRPVGGLLNLTGLPPLTAPLPTPASLNGPYMPRTDADAAKNGLARAGSTDTAPDVRERAAGNGNSPESASPSGSSGTSRAQGSAGAPGTSAGTASGSTSAGSSAAPPPTVFTGTGDSVGSFTFAKDSTSVTCRAPSTESTGEIDVTCTDRVARRVSASLLDRSAVTSATDSRGVWTVSVTETATATSATLTIASAEWQTPTPTSTTTPATTTPETTTPDATTTETTTQPTTETTAPAPVPETTTPPEVPTTTTTTTPAA